MWPGHQAAPEGCWNALTYTDRQCISSRYAQPLASQSSTLAEVCQANLQINQSASQSNNITSTAGTDAHHPAAANKPIGTASGRSCILAEQTDAVSQAAYLRVLVVLLDPSAVGRGCPWARYLSTSCSGRLRVMAATSRVLCRLSDDALRSGLHAIRQSLMLIFAQSSGHSKVI